ncbi:MAG: TonB-dependent receptor [Bacteroidia bacterium]
MSKPMKRAVFAALLLFQCISYSQVFGQRYTISGFVRSEGGESLIAANVFVKELKRGAITNEYGFYSITIEKGIYEISVSYLGFETSVIRVELNKSVQHNFTLKPASITRQEVVIEAERADQNVQDAIMGRAELNIEQVKSLPALLGEVDILKTIQLLPGVQTAGEGNTGFYVRGGGPDQNLILLDEAVVYNAAHLFGFFSVFNADAINNTTLIKGGMPAQYGGRVSSVLNINMREGNNQRFKSEGGIGLIASRFTTEGPLVKDKGSFILSGRRTYIDILADPFVPADAPAKGSRYYFYDLNAKLNYRISDKDRIYASAYFGRDVFLFRNRDTGLSFEIPWGNATTTLRWNHLFSNKLFMNVSAIYSDFNFGTAVEQSDFRFALNSGVKNATVKVDFDYFPSLRHQLKWGMNYTYHTFTPSVVEARSGDNVFNLPGATNLNAHELAFYVQDQWDITDRFQLNAGLRYSNYTQVGPYLFERFADVDLLEKVEERSFNRGDRVVNYDGIEPRLSMRYSLNQVSSLKFGATRNMQYIHLASSSGNALPTDLWVPSTLKVKPQIGYQYSLGYFRNFLNNTYETSVEVYYKQLENQIDFRDGAVNGLNSNIENDFVFGNGEAYGSEFFIQKRKGAFTGWIGYTLAWAWRQFPDIMDGRRFPYKFDRRHDLSLVGSYKVDDRWIFSSTFVYATGNAFTIPESRYFIEGRIINQIGDRNNLRLASYHRLDLAAVYNPRSQQTKKVKSEWVFAIYNVYSRLNPYFVYLSNEGSIEQQSLTVEARQVSLFPILPSVSWNFKF